MKIKEIHQLQENELKVKVLEFKKELFNLRCQKAAGQLTNTLRMRYVRRSIAKLLSILNQRSRKAGEHNA